MLKKRQFNFHSLAIGMVMLCNACGTTIPFAVKSDPLGGLIAVHKEEDINSANISGGYTANPDKKAVTPFEQKVLFLKDESYYISVEKRGYKPSLQLVNKDSNREIILRLEKIEGVQSDAEIFDRNKLKTSTFSLLPIDVEVMIHSGLGNLDKNTYSPEMTERASQKISEELKKAFAERNTLEKQLILMDSALEVDWVQAKEQTRKYLAGLNPVRLPYYSYPPLLTSGVTETQPFFDRLKQALAKPVDYLYYIRAKCISETTGRKVGNFLLSLAGAAVQGYYEAAGTYFYYDPSAFDPDTGTLITLYVIDAGSSEVVLIEQNYFGYDITKDEELLKLVKIISDFPRDEKK